MNLKRKSLEKNHSKKSHPSHVFVRLHVVPAAGAARQRPHQPAGPASWRPRHLPLRGGLPVGGCQSAQLPVKWHVECRASAVSRRSVRTLGHSSGTSSPGRDHHGTAARHRHCHHARPTVDHSGSGTGQGLASDPGIR